LRSHLPPCSPSVALALLVLTSTAGVALATPPGDVDIAFGTGGRVVTDFLGDDVARAVLVQSDGKIVVGGTRFLNGNMDFAMARYEPTGVLDPGFGAGGKITTDFGATDDQLRALALQPDGKLLALGNDSGNRLVMARYETDGALDATFGLGGRVETLPNTFMTDIALQSDGNIVVGGGRTGAVTSEWDFLVARFTANGALDAGFGSGGVVTTNFPANRQDGARALAIQPDGKIVLGGYSVVGPATVDEAWARYDSDGVLDPAFGIGGLALTHFASNGLMDVIVMPDGTLVATVPLANGLVRLLSDGTLDLSFGAGGLAVVPGVWARSVARDATGAFVVGVESVGSPVHVVRVLPDGGLDGSFGVDGRVPFDVFSDIGNGDQDLAVALQPDGGIVAAGTTSTDDDFVVTRLAGTHVERCPAAPLAGCRVPVRSQGASLQIDRRHGVSKLAWRWRRGAATTLADIGDPTSTDDLAFCLYDETGTPVLVTESLAPSGGTCDDRSCWRARGIRKFSYGDEAGTPSGIVALEAKAGTSGKADLRLRAAGDTLTLPTMPLGLPVRAQLVSSTGVCWESVFTSSHTRRNDGSVFHSKSE
jgi:uncharacterized delta-60 repeat protein